MDKHFKYQVVWISLYWMLEVVNVLFSKFIDVVLKLNYQHFNSNYSIYVKLNMCIRLGVVLKLNYLTVYRHVPKIWTSLNNVMVLYIRVCY